MNRRIIDAFFEGQSISAYEVLGAHVTLEETKGVRFSVYAPAAKSIQVIGSFNDWSCEGCYMEKVDERGIWSLFIPGVKSGCIYKYRVEQCSGVVVDKSDPFGFYSELRPNTGSIVVDSKFKFTDSKWMKKRTRCIDSALNIYEVNIGAWKFIGEDNEVNYRTIAPELIKYLKEMHYTHIEFMPLSEFPFDGSWGYQTTGYYAVTSRYGSVDDLKYLINELHKNGIGVIFDFVPVHFVMDNYALRSFDGTHLYEYPKDEDAYSEWGTANFNLWKEEVRSFLMSAAAYWLKEMHGDGLRMDAISNVIFWQGNKDRGVNEGALAFVRRMNYKLHEAFESVMLIAEDSSDFPNVTKPTIDNGLGFDYKWDLGWMNDTLEYMKMDPVYRQYHHNDITFSMAYFYSERFILPFSHDEVVHGKATITQKMWGLYEDKFAQARCLYTYMYMHPGKKLNFMGNEIGHMREFDEKVQNDWFLLDYPMHDSFRKYISELNKLYLEESALHEKEYDYRSFEWIDADNKEKNIFSFVRKGKDDTIVAIFNMSPNRYEDMWFGVNEGGYYKEILNSEDSIYNGCGITNPKAVRAKKEECNFKPYHIKLDIAPFAGLVLKHKNAEPKED